MVKLVPTAVFISRPVTKTKTGMIRKPPPAPTRPVRTPTARPSVRMTAIFFHVGKGVVGLVAFFPTIIPRAAKSIKTANRSIKKVLLVRVKDAVSRMISGIRGTRCARVR